MPHIHPESPPTTRREDEALVDVPNQMPGRIMSRVHIFPHRDHRSIEHILPGTDHEVVDSRKKSTKTLSKKRSSY